MMTQLNPRLFFQPAVMKRGDGEHFFMMLYHDVRTEAWYFWVYFTGTWSAGRQINSRFDLVCENARSAVASSNVALLPLDVKLQQVPSSAKLACCACIHNKGWSG